MAIQYLEANAYISMCREKKNLNEEKSLGLIEHSALIWIAFSFYWKLFDIKSFKVLEVFWGKEVTCYVS